MSHYALVFLTIVSWVVLMGSMLLSAIYPPDHPSHRWATISCVVLTVMMLAAAWRDGLF